MLILSVLIVMTIISNFASSEGVVEFKYHTNDEMEYLLKEFASTESVKLRKKLYSIGNSSGRPKSGIKQFPLWVLELTAGPESKTGVPNIKLVGNIHGTEPVGIIKSIKQFPLWVLELTAAPESKTGVPNIKLVGNIHGTEPVGREILLHFIEHLTNYYGKDETITWLLENTRIHILPSLNPDGFAVANEFHCNHCYNCLGLGVTDNDIVISSNFPDYFHPNSRMELANETLAVIKWMEDVKFILSGSFFASYVVAIYPYCNKNETFTVNSTPDNDVFEHLAKTYSNNHPTMHKGFRCPGSSRSFENGIINGASWHNHDSDMTDYNYFCGCMDVRFEISCCKYPVTEDLQNFWNDNKNSLVQFSLQANRGVTGLILDAVTEKPVEATLKIVGREMQFRNFKTTGEFWRILLPGDYIIQVEAEGYHPHKENFTVRDYGEEFPMLRNLTIFLLNSSVTTTTMAEKTTTTQITTTLIELTSEDSTVSTSNVQARAVRQYSTDFACHHKQNFFTVGVLIFTCFLVYIYN